jgi:hypothetical protein
MKKGLKLKPLPKQYGAPPGSKRAALLRKAARLYKSGRKRAAFKMRDRMERKVRRGKKAR